MRFNPQSSLDLIKATEQGDHSRMQALLQRDDLDINIPNAKGLSVCMIAAMQGDDAAMKLLICRDDLLINAQSEGGLSALIWAASLNHAGIVQSLLKRGDLDVDACNEAGVTALRIADVAGHTDVVNCIKEFKDRGLAVPDQRDGTAPMYAGGFGILAIEEGFKACVDLLCHW